MRTAAGRLRGLRRLERCQGVGQYLLLRGAHVGELDAALVVIPPVARQGLPRTAESGPDHSPREPEHPEARREVHGAGDPVGPRLQVGNPCSKRAEVQEMHDVGFEVAPPEVAGHVHPQHAPPFWLSPHPAHFLAAAMCAATAATPSVVSASSSNVIPNVNPYLERLRLVSDRVHAALHPLGLAVGAAGEKAGQHAEKPPLDGIGRIRLVRRHGWVPAGCAC